MKNPSTLIKGIQTLAHQQNVTVTDDNFDIDKLKVIAGIDQSPTIPEVKFAAARGIKISFEGEYGMRIERPERLPHATHLGKYDWKSLTAERTTTQGFWFALDLVERKKDLTAKNVYGMPPPIFIALVTTFYTAMYADAIETPKRWSSPALELHMQKTRNELPKSAWKRYWQVVDLVISSLRNNQTLAAKQADELEGVVINARP